MYGWVELVGNGMRRPDKALLSLLLQVNISYLPPSLLTFIMLAEGVLTDSLVNTVQAT